MLYLIALGYDLPVVRVTDALPYKGAIGMVCKAEFLAVRSNAQSQCPSEFSDGIVLYAPVLEQGMGAVVNALAHEYWHYEHPEKHTDLDPFNEASAYRAGCRAWWVANCSYWLERYR